MKVQKRYDPLRASRAHHCRMSGPAAMSPMSRWCWRRVAVVSATATLLGAACVPNQSDPDLGSSDQKLGGIEGTFEYAIDAPWRIEPDAQGTYGAIPINVAIHDVMFDSLDGQGFGGARFSTITVKETLPDGTVLARNFGVADLAEIEATRGCWAPTFWTLDSVRTGRVTCSDEPNHRICRDPASCDDWFLDLSDTSEWHAVLWYEPHEEANANRSNTAPGTIVPLTVSVNIRADSSNDNGWRIVPLVNHLRVKLAERPLPRFGDGWLYGDLHYHSQGTDNDGESAYNYRNVVRAMGAMGLDFVFATDHASDSEQLVDADVDIDIGLSLIKVEAVVGGALRDMNSRRFIDHHGLIHGADGANAEVAPVGVGMRAAQSVRSHGVVPQLFLGGEVDVIPESDGDSVLYGDAREYLIRILCNGWHGDLWLANCDENALLESADDGGFLVKDVQGINNMDYGREHLIYMPRTSELYLDGQLAFVSSRTGRFGGGGRRLSRAHGGKAPVLPEIRSKGYAFIAHPLNDAASEGPDGPPWSERMLKQAWMSEAVLGLQLWNEDASFKTTFGSDDLGEELGYDRPTHFGQEIPSNDSRPGFNLNGFELIPFELTTGRWQEAILDEWKVHAGTLTWDKMNMWGLDPTKTNALSDWLPAGAPRRTFMAGGSDAHGDLNYHRSGYFLGTKSVSDGAIGKPRNLVFVGEPTRETGAGGVYSQKSIVDALAIGNFSVTNGPALRIVVDRTRNGVIDPAGDASDRVDAGGVQERPDIPMGGVGHFYDADGEIPVFVEWTSTAEFGEVDRITWVIGTRCANGQERSWRTTTSVSPSLSGIVSKTLRPSSMACGNNDEFSGTRSPVTGFWIRAEAHTKPDVAVETLCRKKSETALAGKCVKRRAYTNPVWLMARNVEGFACPVDYRAFDANGNGIADGCEADDLVGIAYQPSSRSVFSHHKYGGVLRGDLRDLDRYGNSSYSLPPGKKVADIVATAFCGKESGAPTHLYTWYRDGTVSEGTVDDLDKIRAPYTFSAPRNPRQIAYVTCVEVASTGHFLAYYKDGTYSSGKADNLNFFQNANPFTMPPGKALKDLVGMVVPYPSQPWRIRSYFRASGTAGEVWDGLFYNLGFYGRGSYAFPVLTNLGGNGQVGGFEPPPPPRSNDIVWQTTSGQMRYWKMQQTTLLDDASIFSPVSSSWTPKGVGDLNGDGVDDLVFQNTNGQVHYWPMKGGKRLTGYNISSPVGRAWSLVGVGDVNGDGTDDIIWQRNDGQVHYWLMRAGKRIAGYNIFTPVGSNWTLRGVGDVNGDQTDDLVWQHSNGQVHYWPMRNGQRVTGSNIYSPVVGGWTLSAVGDLNSDGTDDIVFQRWDGQIHYWPMNNGNRTGGVDIATPVDNSRTLVGIGDLD